MRKRSRAGAGARKSSSPTRNATNATEKTGAASKGRPLASGGGDGASQHSPAQETPPASPPARETTSVPEGRGWPADRIERRLVADLLPSARNARTHSKKQIRQVADAIQKWGWTNPVLISDTGEIIAGHGRVLAAKLLKIAEVPVMVASGWSDAERRAYMIADNQLALNSGWDEELLRLELGELKEEGAIDLTLTGLSDKVLARQVSTDRTLSGDFAYSVIVDCEGEDHQREVIERLEAEGLKCRLLTL